MRSRRNQVGGLLLLVVSGLFLSGLLSNAQQTSETVPLDRAAIFRTHVAHRNANLWRSQSGSSTTSNGVGNSAKPGGGSGGSIFAGTLYKVGDTVTPTTTTGPEAEEHIAVSPSDSTTLVAAISDFSVSGGWNRTRYAFSTDITNNWASWNDAFVELDANNRPVTSDNQSWDANSDPVVAIDKAGNAYLADLYFNATNGNGANGLYVSVDNVSGGVYFTKAATYPVAANLSPSTNIDEDKEWIAVDNSNSQYSGRVYVSWTRFVGNSDMIMVSYSADQGHTWSPAIQVSPTNQNGGVQGSAVAVGPSGEVYVVWEVFFIGGQRRHYLSTSSDGGANFLPATPVQSSFTFTELKFNSTYRKNSFPALAVSPTNGDVYVVYADQPSNTVGAQIEFMKSTDGGLTFSKPVVINDVSTGQQFFPAVTVDGAGVIHVSWFDTRKSGGTSSLYDIYATRSTDAGAHFTPNAKVTGSIINAGSASFIGDYSGIAAGGGSAHPVWTNGGFNGGKLQTATLH